MEVIKAGMTFKEISDGAWKIPEKYAANRYFVLAHGVGMSGAMITFAYRAKHFHSKLLCLSYELISPFPCSLPFSLPIVSLALPSLSLHSIAFSELFSPLPLTFFSSPLSSLLAPSPSSNILLSSSIIYLLY